MEDKRTKKDEKSQSESVNADITNVDQINNQLNGKYSFSLLF